MAATKPSSMAMPSATGLRWRACGQRSSSSSDIGGRAAGCGRCRGRQPGGSCRGFHVLRGAGRLPFPWQQLVQLMVRGSARERYGSNIGQPAQRVDAVQPRRGEKARRGWPNCAATFGTGPCPGQSSAWCTRRSSRPAPVAQVSSVLKMPRRVAARIAFARVAFTISLEQPAQPPLQVSSLLSARRRAARPPAADAVTDGIDRGDPLDPPAL